MSKRFGAKVHDADDITLILDDDGDNPGVKKIDNLEQRARAEKYLGMLFTSPSARYFTNATNDDNDDEDEDDEDDDKDENNNTVVNRESKRSSAAAHKQQKSFLQPSQRETFASSSSTGAVVAPSETDWSMMLMKILLGGATLTAAVFTLSQSQIVARLLVEQNQMYVTPVHYAIIFGIACLVILAIIV